MSAHRRFTQPAATLALHHRTSPIARANVHAAEAARRWADSRPAIDAVPMRQDDACMQTERFRYDAGEP